MSSSERVELLNEALPLPSADGATETSRIAWTILLLAGTTVVIFALSWARRKEYLVRLLAGFGIAFAIWFSNLVDRIWGHGTFQRLIWFFARLANSRARPNYFSVEHFVGEAEKRSGIKANFDEYERLEKAQGNGSSSGGMVGSMTALVEDFHRRHDRIVLPFGIIREQLVRWLQSRIMVNDYLLKNPRVRSIPIRRPLIITGLWRTGTTLLYSLIAQDPKSRSPQLWEIQKPIPPPTKDTYTTDPRILDVARDVSAVELITAGEHKNIHDLVADAPEECAFIFFMDCLVFNHLLNDRLPDYVKYLRTTHDMQGSYNFYKRMLQVFASNYPPEDHFTLKSPYPHLYHLETLLKTFPDACVVVCHRDPFKCIPSMMSLNAVFSRAFWKDFDPQRTAHYTLDVLAEGAKVSTQFRESLPPEYEREHFFDCHFEDFVEDPIVMVHRIYSHFNYETSPEFESRMQAYMLEQKKAHNQSEKHKYTLETFGLTPDDVREKFDHYLKKHNYPRPIQPRKGSA